MKNPNIGPVAYTSAEDVDLALYAVLPRHDYMSIYAASGNRANIQCSGVDFGAYKYVALLLVRLMRDLH